MAGTGGDTMVQIVIHPWVKPMSGAVARLALSLGYEELPRWLLQPSVWLVYRFGISIKVLR